jgi:hypothetical protein
MRLASIHISIAFVREWIARPAAALARTQATAGTKGSRLIGYQLSAVSAQPDLTADGRLNADS